MYEDAFVSTIIEMDLKIGVMINQYTMLSKKTAPVICIRNTAPDSCKPSTLFCNMVEMNNMSTLTILNSVIRCLHKYLLRNLISFIADGASNIYQA